jgi:hypothetical protein
MIAGLMLSGLGWVAAGEGLTLRRWGTHPVYDKLETLSIIAILAISQNCHRLCVADLG